jgi:hypothetical protein
MPLNKGSTGYPNVPYLDYDTQATTAFKLEIPPAGKIDLQFPPKINSDRKRAKWQEQHNYGYEEYPLFEGAYAREVSIELNYVIWGDWNAGRIADEVRKIKEHLYESGVKAQPKVPFFRIAGWKVIEASGVKPTFRLMDVSLTYSKEYVGKGAEQWPLHTKVDLSCKLITDGGSGPGSPRIRALSQGVYGQLRTSAQLRQNKGWF